MIFHFGVVVYPCRSGGVRGAVRDSAASPARAVFSPVLKGRGAGIKAAGTAADAVAVIAAAAVAAGGRCRPEPVR